MTKSVKGKVKSNPESKPEWDGAMQSVKLKPESNGAIQSVVSFILIVSAVTASILNQ